MLKAHKIKFELIRKTFSSGQTEGTYVIAGPVGCGKQAFAQEIINLVLPKTKQSANTYYVIPEIIKKKGLEKEKQISVDQIRQAIHFMSLSSGSSFKICVIKKAEKMTEGAQNALLKSLEEPKKGNIFLLIAEARDKLAATILSRSSIIKLGLINPNNILKYLIEKGFSGQGAKEAAIFSGGRIRIAEELVSDAGGFKKIEQHQSELESLIRSDLYERINFFEKKSQNLNDVLEELDNWIVILTSFLETQETVGGNNCKGDTGGNSSGLGKQMAISYNRSKIAGLLGSLMSMRQKLKHSNVSLRLALEAAFLNV